MDDQTPATREAILRYARESCGTEPDCPFSGDTETLVLRHADNGKWFALLMRVKNASLGLPGEGATDVMNVKTDPALGVSLRAQRGILPAYHMNREHWVSVLLDGSVPMGLAGVLVEMSFAATIACRARKQRKGNPDIS